MPPQSTIPRCPILGGGIIPRKTSCPTSRWFSHYLTIQKGFIRQTSTSNIFHAKTRRKRRRRTGIASGETAFFVLRPLGSRYCLRNFLVTHLTASSSFHLSVIGSFHFPGLHAIHCKLLAWNSVSKQHSTCLPEAPQNSFFCAYRFSFAPPWKTALPLLRVLRRQKTRLRVQTVQVRIGRKAHKTCSFAPTASLLRRRGRRRYRFFAFFDVKKRGFACKLSRYALAGRPSKGGAKRRREQRSGRESSAPRSKSNFLNRNLDMLLLCQQRRVNIFKSHQCPRGFPRDTVGKPPSLH
jgi:hypothetical protein